MPDLNAIFYPSTAADVTPAMLTAAEEVYDGWFSDDERIDWEDFIDRLCKWGLLDEAAPWEFEEYDNPAIEKIKRHIRAYRNA
jgi:hypothetical protein